MIKWWYSHFSEEITKNVCKVIESRSFSQGITVSEFEDQLASTLGYKKCICVTSGTAALMLPLVHYGIGPASTVVVPDRTWIATSHSAKILGSDIVVAPVNSRFLIDTSILDSVVDSNTSAIVPVFMNGRVFDPRLIDCSAPEDVPIIYDCAQAFGSRLPGGKQISSSIQIGAYSLSVAKTISSGQGGFIGVNDISLGKELAALRTHGLENVMEPDRWPIIGCNFRMTDLTAAVGISQLQLLHAKIQGLLNTYQVYVDRLASLSSLIQILPVSVDLGEIPQYVECWSPYSMELRDYLYQHSIETRGFFPPVSTAPYVNPSPSHNLHLGFDHQSFFILPSGPDRDYSDLRLVCDAIEAFFDSI
jgi:perosamine synthetase